ncbi:MAG: sirohydrochlorin chelatase [Opitutales bacterium]
MNLPICLLVDNGSLRPEAVLGMRRVAQKLSSASSFVVRAVSLLHSDKIAPSKLNHENGVTIETFLASEQGSNEKKLLVLPFFLGPSRGITEWLREKLKDWEQKKSGRSFKILDTLYLGNEKILAQALDQQIEQVRLENKLPNPHVAMVDHGTPVFEVNQVRERVGMELNKLFLKGDFTFSTCSMERREGDEFAFNDPLLEQVLAKWGRLGVEQVVLALFFLLPGRHAGKNGDLVEICKDAEKKFPQMKIFQTLPLGEENIIFEILMGRLNAELVEEC